MCVRELSSASIIISTFRHLFAILSGQVAVFVGKGCPSDTMLEKWEWTGLTSEAWCSQKAARASGCFGTHVATLQPGDVFGERGILVVPLSMLRLIGKKLTML